MTDLPGPWFVIPLGLLVALGAGIVRGFAGFGFSALSVAGLSLFVPPATVIPALLILEIAASIGLVRSAIADVDRTWMRALLIGNLVCIPLGIAALIVLPVNSLRLLVSSALLAGSFMLKMMGGRQLPSSPKVRLSAGVISGLLNGLTASGGVAAAMMMSAAKLSPTALRGTMVIFLLFCGSYALLWAGLLSRQLATGTSLLSMDTLRWVLLFLPGMFAGIWIGRRQFSRAQPSSYRTFVLNLLILISALGLMRSVITLLSQ